MKFRKSFIFEKVDKETGLKVRFEKSCEGYSFPLFRAPCLEKLEGIIERWKTKENGFPTIGEIEDLLHGRW